MENRAKPRSAPGMKSKVLESKFVRAKSDRTKEIEGWAKHGMKNIEVIRQSGGLSENITEDLMLHDKVMDLSKARYKFMVNNKYEQKIFLQRQKKKSVALRDALKDIDLERNAPKWATEAPVSRSNGSLRPDTGKENDQPPLPRSKSNTPIKCIREKPESAPARRRMVTPDNQHQHPPRPQTRATYSVESRISSASTEHNFFQTQPKIIKKSRRLPSENEAGLLIPAATKSAVTFSEPPKTANSTTLGHHKPLPRQSSLRRGSLHKPQIASWAKKKDAIKFDQQDDKAPLRDERYTELTGSLSNVYRGRKGPEVAVIVNMLEALHAPTSRPLESRRPKVTAKIKDFLNQMGITAC